MIDVVVRGDCPRRHRNCLRAGRRRHRRGPNRSGGQGTDLHEIRAAAAYLGLDPDVALTWVTTGGYLDLVRAARPSLNVLTFVPHALAG